MHCKLRALSALLNNKLDFFQFCVYKFTKLSASNVLNPTHALQLKEKRSWFCSFHSILFSTIDIGFKISVLHIDNKWYVYVKGIETTLIQIKGLENNVLYQQTFPVDQNQIITQNKYTKLLQHLNIWLCYISLNYWSSDESPWAHLQLIHFSLLNTILFYEIFWYCSKFIIHY